MVKKLIIILIVSFIFIGCDTVKNNNTPLGETKEQNGFRYILTEIEGKKFIAYQTSYSYWELAGPID